MKSPPRARLGWLLLAPLGLTLHAARLPDAVAAAPRGYASAHFALSLDGSTLGLVKSFQGGGAVAQVIEERSGAASPKKHLGAVRYDDIELEVDLTLDKPLYDWIAASWRGSAPRHHGSILSLDVNYQSVGERTFQDAALVETIIPACDAASKERAALGLRIAASSVRAGKGAGATKVPAAGKRSPWQRSNFRLELDGIDATRVSRIEAFSVKSGIASSVVGAERVPAKQPAGVQFPHLKVTLAESGAQSWQNWHEDFVIKGQNGDQLEKRGRIVFLGPDLKQVLLSIELHNVGIFALEPSRQAAASAGIRQLDAQLYVERMEFSLNGAK